MKKILLFFIFFYSSHLFSAGLNFGGFSPFLGVYQVDEDGGSNTFDLKPYISAYGRIALWNRLSLRPEVGHVFAYKPLEDNKNQSISYSFLLVNFSYDIFNQFYINAGVGTFWQKIKSVYGQKTFSNGNSTSTYYYPGLTVTSTTSTFNLGIEKEMGKRMSFSLMTYWFSPLDSEKRAMSYTLSLGINL